jgi:hypothetical protein
LPSFIFAAPYIALFTTTPTSLAGAAAASEYVSQLEFKSESAILANTSFESSDGGSPQQASRDFLPMIANTIRRLSTS